MFNDLEKFKNKTKTHLIYVEQQILDMNTLPNEMLIKIFEYTLGCHLWLAIPLKTVCKLWYETIGHWPAYDKKIVRRAIDQPLILGPYEKSAKFCAHLASCGYLGILKWSIAQGWSYDSILMTEFAANGGHLNILKWLKEHNDLRSRTAYRESSKKGHLEILKWLKEENYKCDDCAFAYAAQNGHMEILQWMKEQRCPWDERACHYAAEAGQLEVLKWLREQDCPWNVNVMCMYAICAGHLEMLKWLRSKGCPWGDWDQWDDCNPVDMSAQDGNLEMLRWIHEQGWPLDESTCYHAARGGRLQVLQWLREQQCPWDEMTCECAAMEGQLEVLQWAHSQGCPLDYEECLIVAKKYKHEKLVQWLLELKKYKAP